MLTTPTAAGVKTTGASLRVREVVQVLHQAGYRTECATEVPAGRYDLAVAVSYACAGQVPALRRVAPRVWLDAVDSWLLVDGSGVAAGRPSYLLRAARDGARLLAMPRPDLLTYISGADLRADRGTVRGRRRLVLPGLLPAPTGEPGDGTRRVVLAGDWGYPPNHDGLAWFSDRVLPLLPGASVVVHGPGAVPRAGLDVRGYAEDDAALYRDGDVHAAPVRFGGGVKRKVLQPLLSGLPVVTTRTGAHGLRPHPLLEVHDRPEAFAAALLRRLAATPGRHPAVPADLLDADDTDAVLAWLRT